MNFTVAWRKFVRYIIEESLQAVQERIHITFANISYKTLNLLWGFCNTYRCIIGQKETEKTLLHLTVRETESVILKFFIIAFDCKITALIDYRHRIGRCRINRV